jgi:predicted flap endonuclease-1-like 5' DNA nuclease
MPYTLAKALGWLVLALALGITIGWLLRSVTAHRQVARARSQRGDAGETERLRARVAELERAERERLPVEPVTGAVTATAAGASADAPATEAVAPGNGPRAPGADLVDAAGDPHPEPTAPILDDATEALGRPVQLDDLKVIDGIGPAVEDLCHGIGIRTWADMATTEVSLLRTMLDDAGARYKTCDPSSWPAQADLLARGRWQEFAALVGGVRDNAATS